MLLSLFSVFPRNIFSFMFSLNLVTSGEDLNFYYVHMLLSRHFNTLFFRNHETQNGILTIPFLKVEDAGEYVCSASNEFGVSQAVVVLRIGGICRKHSSKSVLKYIYIYIYIYIGREGGREGVYFQKLHTYIICTQKSI